MTAASEWGTNRGVGVGSTLAIAAIVAFGSLAQRISGMGFALIAAPFLVLLVGPHEGVILANVASAATAALVLPRVFSHIDWRSYLWLVLPALAGIAPGALLATSLDSSLLELAIGSFLALALVLSISAKRITATLQGPVPRVLAGFFSGLSSAAAGISGPPMSLYAVLSRWPQQTFAATMQPFFLTLGITSVLAKLLLDPGRWPVLPVWFWASLLVALVIGTSLGDRLSRRVSALTARSAMLSFAVLGALAVAVHGFFTLIGS